MNAAVVDEKMAWAGRQCRWMLEEAGLFPAREVTEEEAPGLLAALVMAAQQLTRREMVGLWMLMLAWGGEKGRQ